MNGKDMQEMRLGKKARRLVSHYGKGLSPVNQPALSLAALQSGPRVVRRPRHPLPVVAD